MEDLLMGGYLRWPNFENLASVNVNIKSTKNEHNLSPKLILCVGKLLGFGLSKMLRSKWFSILD